MRAFGRAALVAAAFAACTARAEAMPPFAQAYGVECTTCHIQVPALNAYGRYVQRTGYGALDHTKLKRSLPFWISYNPSYDSQNADAAHKVQSGNVGIHAVGQLSTEWSYHVQQWIAQNDQPGGLDTAWVAYNGLLRRHGHLFFGKIESPAPSPFSQWFDLAGFAVPGIAVGEHTYALDANRWGARFAYVTQGIDAEIGWLGSSADLGGASDFSNANDKTVQWKLAAANPKSPLEVGLFGSRGSFPLSEGGADQYRSLAFYAQRDPVNAAPGFLVLYQRAFDRNPGSGAGPATSSAASIELYRRFFGDRALVAARKEYTNDGLGNVSQSGNLDVEYHVARFIHAYAEMYLAQHQKPGFRAMIWWSMPLSKVPEAPAR